MKLLIQPLAIVAVLSTHVLANITTWPDNPKLILTPYEAAGCKSGRGIGASPPGVEVPSNECVGFFMNKSYQAVLETSARGQTCVLTTFTGSGCNLYPQSHYDLDIAKAKTCFDTNLPYGWLGGGDEASWSVMYNCNLAGH